MVTTRYKKVESEKKSQKTTKLKWQRETKGKINNGDIEQQENER